MTRSVSATGEAFYPYGQRRVASGLYVPRKGRVMEKGLTFGALGVSALMFLIFLLDMIAGFPFGGGAFTTVDVLGVFASGVVAYLAWNASRDLK